MVPGLSKWPQYNRKCPYKSEQVGQSHRGGVVMGTEVGVMVLKMEEGTMSQEMQSASGNWEARI